MVNRYRISNFGFLLGSLICALGFGQDAEELFKAEVYGRLELQNCDLIITQDIKYTPEDKTVSLGAWGELKIKQRLVIDYEAKRCFRLKRISRVDDVTGKKLDDAIEFASFDKGLAVAYPPNVFGAPKKPAEFFPFLHRNTVPRPELLGIMDVGGTCHGKSPEDHAKWAVDFYIQRNLVHVVQRLADGTVRVTSDKKQSVYTVKMFDPKYSIPTRVDVFYSQGDRFFQSHTKEFELVNGFTRPLKAMRKADEVIFIGSKEKEVKVTSDTFETFQWLQFNSQSLEWPDEDAVMKTRDSGYRFIDGKAD